MWTHLSDFFQKINRDSLFSQAAALAFYSALSFAPLLLLMLATFSTLNLELQQDLVVKASNFWGDSAASLISPIMEYAKENRDRGRVANAIGVLTLLFSASLMFAQMQMTLNQIFDVPIDPNLSWTAGAFHFLWRRLRSLIMVLAFVLISILSIVGSAAVTIFITDDFKWISELILLTMNFIVYTFLFTAIFHWMPDQLVNWRASFWGGFWAALLFIIGKIPIAAYIERSSLDLAYGAAGSIIVLLLWVYYSSLIFFIGAEISGLIQRTEMRRSTG